MAIMPMHVSGTHNCKQGQVHNIDGKGVANSTPFLHIPFAGQRIIEAIGFVAWSASMPSIAIVFGIQIGAPGHQPKVRGAPQLPNCWCHASARVSRAVRPTATVLCTCKMWAMEQKEGFHKVVV
jgi:hypothetical protein